MIIKSETRQQWKERMTEPHKKFAWLPVRMPDGNLVWLQNVTRKLDYGGTNGHSWEIWRYDYI